MNSHLTSVRNDKGLLRVGAQEVQQTPWERWTDQLGIGCHRRRHATDTVHTIKLIHRSARSGCEAATSSACLPDHVPLFNGMLLSLAINRLACAAYVYCSKQLLPWFHAHRRSPTSRHAPRCGSGEHFATNEKRSKCTPCKLRCHEGTAPDMRAITGMSFMNPHNCFRVDPATSRPGAALTCERAAQVRFRACGPWLGRHGIVIVIVIIFQVIEREARVTVGSAAVCGSTVPSGPATAGVAVARRAGQLSLLLCSGVLLRWRGRGGEHGADLLHACCDNRLQVQTGYGLVTQVGQLRLLSTAGNRCCMPVTVLELGTARQGRTACLTQLIRSDDGRQGCGVRCRGPRRTCLTRAPA